MGLEITYVAKKDQISFRLSHVDTEIMQVLAKNSRDDIYLLFNVSDFGEETEVDREDLLSACQRMLERLQRESGDLFCVYKYRIPEGLAADTRPGAGGTSGIRMNKEEFVYSIWSGVGYCNLIKSGIDKNGMGYDIETIDIRPLKKLKTDNMGEIEIYRQKKDSPLEELLTSLKQFLERQDDKTIVKVLG
jgi:hypothetical protein